jgi:hypothetical protein
MDLPPTDAALPPRLTMRAFWRELGDGMFNLERGLPWTFWRLLRAPGALIRDFVVRRDPRIVRPVRWFLLGFGLLALVFQAAGGGDVVYASIAAETKGGADASSDAQAFWWLLTKAQWLLLVSVVPAGAAGLCKAYRREQPEFAEMWVFCLYVAGQAMLLIALLATLEGLSGWPVFGYAALATVPALYVAACVGYFRTPLPGRLLRAGLALAIGAALTLLFFTACLFAAMATFRQVG